MLQKKFLVQILILVLSSFFILKSQANNNADFLEGERYLSQKIYEYFTEKKIDNNDLASSNFLIDVLLMNLPNESPSHTLRFNAQGEKRSSDSDYNPYDVKEIEKITSIKSSVPINWTNEAKKYLTYEKILGLNDFIDKVVKENGQRYNFYDIDNLKQILRSRLRVLFERLILDPNFKDHHTPSTSNYFYQTGESRKGFVAEILPYFYNPQDGKNYFLLGSRSDQSGWGAIGGGAEANDLSLAHTAIREIEKESAGGIKLSLLQLAQGPSHMYHSPELNYKMYTTKITPKEKFLTINDFLEKLKKKVLSDSGTSNEYSDFEMVPVDTISLTLNNQDQEKVQFVNHLGQKKEIDLHRPFFQMLKQGPVREQIDTLAKNKMLSPMHTQSWSNTLVPSLSLTPQERLSFPECQAKEEKLFDFYTEIMQKVDLQVSDGDACQGLNGKTVSLEFLKIALQKEGMSYDENKNLLDNIKKLVPDETKAKLLETIMNKETSHPNTLELAHATTGAMAFVYDVMSQLKNFLYQRKGVSTTTLRGQDELFRVVPDVNKLLQKAASDINENHVGLACATNFSIWANWNTPGESTYDCFFRNSSIDRHDSNLPWNILQRFFSVMGISNPSDYIQKLKNYYEKKYTKLGSRLFQFFIQAKDNGDTNSLDSYVYFCTGFGSSDDAIKNPSILTRDYPQTIIDTYQKIKSQKDPHSFQARLLLHPDFMNGEQVKVEEIPLHGSQKSLVQEKEKLHKALDKMGLFYEVLANSDSKTFLSTPPLLMERERLGLNPKPDEHKLWFQKFTDEALIQYIASQDDNIKNLSFYLKENKWDEDNILTILKISPSRQEVAKKMVANFSQKAIIFYMNMSERDEDFTLDVLDECSQLEKKCRNNCIENDTNIFYKCFELRKIISKLNKEQFQLANQYIDKRIVKDISVKEFLEIAENGYYFALNSFDAKDDVFYDQFIKLVEKGQRSWFKLFAQNKEVVNISIVEIYLEEIKNKYSLGINKDTLRDIIVKINTESTLSEEDKDFILILNNKKVTLSNEDKIKIQKQGKKLKDKYHEAIKTGFIPQVAFILAGLNEEKFIYANKLFRDLEGLNQNFFLKILNYLYDNPQEMKRLEQIKKLLIHNSFLKPNDKIQTFLELNEFEKDIFVYLIEKGHFIRNKNNFIKTSLKSTQEVDEYKALEAEFSQITSGEPLFQSIFFLLKNNSQSSKKWVKEILNQHFSSDSIVRLFDQEHPEQFYNELKKKYENREKAFKTALEMKLSNKYKELFEKIESLLGPSFTDTFQEEDYDVLDDMLEIDEVIKKVDDNFHEIKKEKSNPSLRDILDYLKEK